jgi:hypothetical protein
VLTAALAAHLRGCPALAGCAVFDAPPVRGGLPFVVVEEPVLADASASGWAGREGRVTVSIADAGERPVRLRGLLDAVEAWVAALPAAIGDGWRVVLLKPVRSRVVRSGGGDRWSGTAEFQVRMWRAEE